MKLNDSPNERFYALQIENKEGRGWLKRHSNRTVIIETDTDGILLSYHFETPAAEIVPVQPKAKIRKEIRLYAKEGDKIFDSHGGSMSSAIACNDLHFDLDICELDKDYFDAGVKRFNNHISQTTLF